MRRTLATLFAHFVLDLNFAACLPRGLIDDLNSLSSVVVPIGEETAKPSGPEDPPVHQAASDNGEACNPPFASGIAVVTTNSTIIKIRQRRYKRCRR